jgi:hypothetical protein
MVAVAPSQKLFWEFSMNLSQVSPLSGVAMPARQPRMDTVPAYVNWRARAAKTLSGIS